MDKGRGVISPPLVVASNAKAFERQRGLATQNIATSHKSREVHAESPSAKAKLSHKPVVPEVMAMDCGFVQFSFHFLCF
jgi:hypothetical protein